jgi:TM2 domain-containing membrane protein YozV
VRAAQSVEPIILELAAVFVSAFLAGDLSTYLGCPAAAFASWDRINGWLGKRLRN